MHPRLKKILDPPLHSIMDNFDNVRLTGIGNLKNTMEQERTIAKNPTFNVFR